MKTNLQTIRKQAGYKSAKAFADHMGIPKDTYTGYEQGRITMSIEKAWEFADELHCSLDELLGRPWPPTSASSDITVAEKSLLDVYRSTDERGRETIDSVAQTQKIETQT